jgi:hypothetical protein
MAVSMNGRSTSEGDWCDRGCWPDVKEWDQNPRSNAKRDQTLTLTLTVAAMWNEKMAVRRRQMAKRLGPQR